VQSKRVRSISKSSVHRILQGAGLKPHRVRMWCTSTDPEYDAKLADITGLYLDPRAGEPVVCIDEKSGMQALSRRHPFRRPKPGKVGRDEFEYRRNGTRCLFRLLQRADGPRPGPFDRSPDPAGLSRVPLRGRPHLPAGRGPRRARQPQHAHKRSGGGLER
jgi:hypothetical protein